MAIGPPIPNVQKLSFLAPFTAAVSSVSSLVAVNPQKTIGYQPQTPRPSDDFVGPPAPPPPALLFHYEGENTALIESDITDHYVEDNSAVADQIALRPEIITVRGYIGELNNIPPAFLAPVKAVADRLTTVSQYAPGFSALALIAYNEAFELYQVGSKAISDIQSAGYAAQALAHGKSIPGGENVIGESGIGDVGLSSGKVNNKQNAQQAAFQLFYAYWRARWLFTVQTPWAVFQNMSIKSLRAVQDEDTRMITDFEVTFKMIRNVKTEFSNITLGQGRLVAQQSDLQDNGISSPSATGGSFLDGMTAQISETA